MLHVLPAATAQRHKLTEGCPCRPELVRVGWRGMQRLAVCHRRVACTCDGDWWDGDHVATCALRRGRP